MSPRFAGVRSSANWRKRISCSSFHTPEYDDIWLCFSTVIRLKTFLTSLLYSILKVWFFFQLFAKYSSILFFFQRFYCKAICFSSKSELPFNQLVVLRHGNQFLFTEDKSRSIRIQHWVGTLHVFHLRAHTFILHDSSVWPGGFVVCTESTYKKYKNICLLYRDGSRVLLASFQCLEAHLCL